MQGHGDVLTVDFAGSDSSEWPNLDADPGETTPPRTLPSLLNKIGLKRSAKGSPAEGMALLIPSPLLPFKIVRQSASSHLSIAASKLLEATAHLLLSPEAMHQLEDGCLHLGLPLRLQGRQINLEGRSCV